MSVSEEEDWSEKPQQQNTPRNWKWSTEKYKTVEIIVNIPKKVKHQIIKKSQYESE